MARLRLVDLVVAAHNGTDTGVDGLCEWPDVKLVHRAVVDVGGVNLSGLGSTAEVFLFIADAGWVLRIIHIIQARVERKMGGKYDQHPE